MQNIFQAALTQKIGWTLVHFVWQAFAIGLLLAVLLKLLRNSSAHLRYLIACGGLALMVCAPVITLQMIPTPPNHTAPAVQPPADITETGFVTPVITDMPDIEIPPVSIAPAAAPALPWQDRFTHTLGAALPYIVAGWLAGVLGLSLWYLGGWTQLQKFRRRMIQPVSPELKAKLHQLAGRLAIRQSIDLFESALVQVPAVVGHLKPAILLPASALTGLSPQQIEVILAHELAHIKRHDYLVNMLQTAVEILGFYHPAVWWVSHRIRIERENCCDDLAVSVCQDRLFYAKALTTMAEIRAAHSAFALTITGPTLFDRIRRLLGQDSPAERKSSWLPSVVAMVLIAALVMPICFALASQTDTDIGKCEPKTITLTIIADNEVIEKDDLVKISLFDFSNEKTFDITKNFKGLSKRERENRAFYIPFKLASEDKGDLLIGDKGEIVVLGPSTAELPGMPLEEISKFGAEKLAAHIRAEERRRPSEFIDLSALWNEWLSPGETGAFITMDGTVVAIQSGEYVTGSKQGQFRYVIVGRVDPQNLPEPKLLEEVVAHNKQIKADRQKLQEWIEDFFQHNYHDITARKTLEWGEPVIDADDNMSIRYKYEATIREKDKVISDAIFTFNKNGEFVSVKKLDQNQVKEPAEKVEVQVYPVNRSVSDFPETEDFSTPESAYAAINRVMAADDPEGWQRVSGKIPADHVVKAPPQKSQVDTEWSKVVLNAKILEVRINDDQAVVIAEFPQELSSKPIQDPIDCRFLHLENGKWLNKGEDRYDAIDQARTKFDRVIQTQLRTEQNYKDVLNKSEELFHLAEELFAKLRQADYKEILSYYDEQTGKWSNDGWKKLDLDYMVHTGWPGFALWVCNTFQDNPIQSVELGEVFISDKEIDEKTKAPAVPYKLVLQDGGILAGDLYFVYRDTSGNWQPTEGIDWHLQDNPIKRPQLPSADPNQPAGVQILTTSYILTIPSDSPLVRQIIPADQSTPIIISPEKLAEILERIKTIPAAHLLASPRIIANDGETAAIEIEDANGFKAIKLTTKNNFVPENNHIQAEFDFQYSVGEVTTSISTTESFPPDHALAAAGITPADGQTIIALVKPEIMEKPLPQTGVVKTDDINSKIAKLDRDNATPENIIKIFGEPMKYCWGSQVFDKEDLPNRYIMVFPGDIHAFILNDHLIELRLEGPSDYVFGNGLMVGSPVEKALEILGQPAKIVDGQPNEFEDNILYKNIDGKKGYGYYARPDKNIRVWILNDKVKAIYLTRSNYSAASGGIKLKDTEVPETSYIDENGNIVDKIDYPFVNDPNVLGGWRSVDFVQNVDDFNPDKKRWNGDLYLKELFFLEGGKTNWGFAWTKGLLLHQGDRTASKYTIKEIGGTKYLFMEWKSGDYTIRHRKPLYYVLKKDNDMVYVESRTVDKIDYPFVNDPAVIGTWKSVDFVDETEQFKAGEKQWKGNLFLKELVILPEGKTAKPWWTWTKGLILHSGDKTASKYIIKEINGSTYMFFEWKSGDYTIRHMKPQYYVLKKSTEDPTKNMERFKQPLEKPVTVHIEHSPDNDRLSVQYAVMAVCQAAGVPYNWDKSVKLAGSECRQYLEPVNIEENVASQAIADMLGSIGLLYGVDADGVYLYKPENAAAVQSNLKILNIELEPVAQGKNVLYATVKNTSATEQLFAIHIYTRSVDYGPQGVGWGTQFFEKFNSNETKRVKFAYKIQGPVTENTYIRVKFYNPSTEAEFDYDKPFAVQVYKSTDVKQKSEEQTALENSDKANDGIIGSFVAFQKLLRDKKYKPAWELFSEDYQKTEYQRGSVERFEKAMEPHHPLDSAFTWEKSKFLALEPKQVTKNTIGNSMTLLATYNNEIWKISFIQEEDQWKIDDITGYRPAILDMQEANNK